MTIRHLQLILPGVLSGDVAVSSDISTVCHWLQSGDRTQLWAADDASQARIEPWQQSLLHALPTTACEYGLASAALTWRGEGGEWRSGTWLQIRPVHFAAGLDDLRMVLPPPPSAEEAEQLLSTLRPLLALSGFELLTSGDVTSGNWYLWTASELQLTTYAPRNLLRVRIHELMPHGPDAGALRRLMTELQMLLHEHPVNQQRARQGLPIINAVWCWGASPLQPVTEPLPIRMISDSAYVRGLCEHVHGECWPVPADAQALLSLDTEQVLLVLPGGAELEKRWLQPLHAALLRGQIKQLDIHLDNGRTRLQGGRWAQLRRKLAGKRRDQLEFNA
jgi:hypothetical protein